MDEALREDKPHLTDAELLSDQKKYLSFMRHELRTPLNAIIGYSEMLMEDAGDDQRGSLMALLMRIHAAGKQLLALVNDLLEQSKVDSGQADLTSETFRTVLSEVMHPSIEIASIVTRDAIREATGLEFTSMLPDLERISSAAEHFVALVDELVEVERPALKQPVREAPVRAEGAVEREVAAPDEQPGEPDAQLALILVVDDNEANRDMLSRRLVMQGHTVARAENGREALDLIQKTSFDLVLLDIMMPEVDGYEVLRQMKAGEATRDIPVIMISALDEIESVVRCLEMGAEDYLPKPFNPVLLKARIGNSLEKKRLRDEQKRLFRTFATSEVADELMARGFSLGGKTVRATVMFSDIRNFTTLSESLTPEEIIQLLNRYYEFMFEVANAHHGTVSLIQGDGLMIIFGAPVPKPDHSELAVRAGLEMLKRLEEFNAHPVVPNQTPIRIGIGIATGKMVVGYAGTRERATYTCIGDTVNLAARLEAHTKVAQMPVLIDEFTQKELGAEFETKPLGPVVYKGKTQPINTYAVLAK